MKTMELVELDPVDGEECELIMAGSWSECIAHRDRILQEREVAWDDLGAVWPILMIQPES